VKAEIRTTVGSTEGAREQQFNELYLSTREDVLSYLVRRARTLEDAADALAETYAAAWGKLDTLPKGDAARLWLFGAARIELLRATDRARHHDNVISSLADEIRSALSDHYPAVALDADLTAAMSHLSVRDQEILKLTAWEELTPREIAIVSGLSSNVVRVRLHRARRQLQALLRNEPLD
jgi:RNA polymerase sigma-70 factor (ECF subfamily)